MASWTLNPGCACRLTLSNGIAGSNRLILWAWISMIGSSALTLILYFSDSSLARSFVSTRNSAPNKTFRRPNPYINLDKIPHNGSQLPFPPLYTYSQLLLQVSLFDSSRTLHEDHRSYRTHEGMVFPDDRHFVVSAEVCTYRQSNAIQGASYLSNC